MKFKYLVLSIIFFLFVNSLWSQNSAFEIGYQKFENGKMDSSYSYSFKFANQIAFLSSEDSKTKEFIDFKREVLVDIMTFDEKLYKTVEPFSEIPQPEFQEENENILGYNCSKAVYHAFSNTIEVWYTKDAEAKGSPYKSYMPENSLVLKIIVNGNRTIVASAINSVEAEMNINYPFDKAEEITKAKARELQIKSRYTNLSVFYKQQINFESDIKNPEFGLIDSVYRLSNGTVILKKIRLPEMVKKGASVFATITNWSNGDAYDRTGSLFMLTEKKDKSMLNALQNGLAELPVITDHLGEKYQGIVSFNDYDVPVELIRFFTSFGVSHFNHLREIENYNWQDSVVYKQEITSLIPNNEEEIWLGIFIGNYDKGGHKVSLELQFYPPWDDEEIPDRYIQPLFNTVNIMEMSGQNYGKLFGNDSLRVDFQIPDSLQNLKLLFTTTGHGGWGGGDEFNPKFNQVFIDGKLVFSHIPWRSDCGTYRMLNPASGNFQNGLSSSDLSRSNWCPATLTPPFIIDLTELKPGEHHLEVVIDQGEDEGSSFSSWCVSGVLTGEVQQE